MTSDLLVSLAGVILSLALAYIPKLSDWYSALDGPAKRLLMLGLLLSVSGGAFGLACWRPELVVGVACDEKSIWNLLRLFLEALAANQGTYLLAVRPPKSEPEL